jgi:hypothetical protein
VLSKTSDDVRWPTQPRNGNDINGRGVAFPMDPRKIPAIQYLVVGKHIIIRL